MAIFNYTLPSGAKYTVETPAGYTQTQADYLFYSQVASGSLVSYTKGQTLSSLQTQITKFELSRLDRGTAGVDTLAVLAITDGSPIGSVPNLSGVALRNPITVADYAQAGAPLGTTPVGPLNSDQTQAVLAQIQNLVDQPSDVVSTDKGVGSYGLGPDQLENAGYLKPGTSNYPDFNCVVGTPSVWTGKNGVYSLADVVGDPALQTQIQTAVMNNGYDALVAGGTIQTPATSPASISTGQVYTSAGVLATLTAPALITGTAALTTNLNSLITKSFAGAGNISSLLSNPVTSIETLASGAVNSLTQAASGAVNALTGAVTGAVNSAIGSATSLVSGLANQATGAVGALITNASQFGSTVTAAWAQGSSALGGAINGLNSASTAISNLTGGANALTGALGSASGVLGSVSGLAGQAQTLVSGALGDLTSLASGAIGSLQGQAQSLLTSLGGSLDIFGKMSQFSIDFSLFSSDSLVSATKVAAGYSNTVNRQTVDAAVNRILGNAKIPTPSFEFPSIGSSAIAADIKYAQQQLQTLASSATGLYNNATGLANTATGAVRNLIG
jgi:hypothetical protein